MKNLMFPAKLAAASVMLSAAWSCTAMDIFVESGNGNFVFSEENGKVWLSSATSTWDGGEFILPAAANGPGLWRLDFRTPDGSEESSVVLTGLGRKPDIENLADGGIRFVWRNLALKDEACVDVSVTVSPLTENGLTDWRIAVENTSAELGLWEVRFPYIEGITVGSDGEMFSPFGTGQIEKDPVMGSGFAGTYPHALYSMQFMGVTERNETLYIATHDGEGYTKGAHFIPHKDRDLGIFYMGVQHPENMGVPGTDYVQPYPYVIGFMEGDWYDAAKFYRNWVLAESNWMEGKLPIAEKTEWPEWFKKLPLWFGYHGMTDDNQRMVLERFASARVPAAVHLYHWHQITFDTNYPDFWPTFGNAIGYAAEMQEKGLKIMPYINCHLIDQQSKSWKEENGPAYIAMPPGQDGTYTEVWASGADVKLTPLCPATEYWQNKYLPLLDTLMTEMNIDGLYLDQIACVKPDLCFNPEHGHPLGGGKHWVEGYEKMIKNMRETAAKNNRFLFLTSESGAEPYDIDIFLRCNEGAPFLSPIWQTVYSGYRASFGYYFELPEEWLPKLAKQYLEGIQIGWGALHAECPQKAIKFQEEVARARYAGSDYIAMGELLRQPQVSGSNVRFKSNWKNFGSIIPIDWPAVQASFWRSTDGSYGIAFVNIADTEECVSVKVFDESLADGKYAVSVLYPEGISVDDSAVADSGSADISFVVPPVSAGIITLYYTGEK